MTNDQIDAAVGTLALGTLALWPLTCGGTLALGERHKMLSPISKRWLLCLLTFVAVLAAAALFLNVRDSISRKAFDGLAPAMTLSEVEARLGNCYDPDSAVRLPPSRDITAALQETAGELVVYPSGMLHKGEEEMARLWVGDSCAIAVFFLRGRVVAKSFYDLSERPKRSV